MTEQVPGELIYEYTIQSTGVTSYGVPFGDLRENVTLTTAEPDYAWVDALQIWARGTVDLAKGEAYVTGYVI
jgi:hypothetical protein